MTKTALLIGISECQSGLDRLPSARRDVETLKLVLENPSIGDFNKVKALFNPDLQTMQSEIETLFSEANRNDLVLLYFSGHGMKDETGKLYFSTAGTRKGRKEKIAKATMVPAHFIHDMMSNCRAKRQSIILDCCFSGAFDPSLSVKDDRSIDFKGQLGAEGRVVMTSSSHLQLSFGEKENSGLSIYTNCLIDGLRSGDADLDQDGFISVLDLHRYISEKTQERLPRMTPKLITFRDLGFDIILAKSPAATSDTTTNVTKQFNKQSLELENIKLQKNNTVSRQDYLPNFLDPYEALIQDLTSSINKLYGSLNEGTKKQKEVDDSTVLNLIQASSKANFVLLLQSDPEGCLSVSAQSDFIEEGENQRLIMVLKTTVLPNTSVESIFNLEHHGSYKRCFINGKDLQKSFIFIPISLENPTEFIVVAGLPDDSCYLGDAYGKVISSFYSNCQSLSHTPNLVEAAIIDDLKKDYKFLSLALYNRRFELFCYRLQEMTVYFEPILELDSLTISGWEALARDPKTATAPYNLFYAAELWGVKFMIELDQYFLREAVTKYQEGRQETKQNRTQDILPLSVNVYPESLTRSAYFKTVKNVVTEENLIPGRKLILEISEKISLPKYNTDKGPKAAWIGFKQELIKYVRQLKVRFAIDDFGVEHASVSQLAGLKPPYIKVDREILFHESRDIIINFVHELGSSNTLDPPSVILEGFDETSPVALGHLKDIGVNYIQGYIVNKAQPQIYRLPEEKIEELRELIAIR